MNISVHNLQNTEDKVSKPCDIWPPDLSPASTAIDMYCHQFIHAASFSAVVILSIQMCDTVISFRVNATNGSISACFCSHALLSTIEKGN